MSAERMAEIEARLREFGGRHPHYNDYVRAERAFVTYAPIDLRWLLDRVRELEVTAEDIAWLRRMEFTTFDRAEAEAHHAWFPSFFARMAARSPSGEGQP